jgi:hypothetical protein
LVSTPIESLKESNKRDSRRFSVSKITSSRHVVISNCNILL